MPAYQELFKYLINTTSAQLYTCQNVSGLTWGYTDAFLQELYDLGLSPVKVKIPLPKPTKSDQNSQLKIAH